MNRLNLFDKLVIMTAMYGAKQDPLYVARIANQLRINMEEYHNAD